jgi:hypothetical protein
MNLGKEKHTRGGQQEGVLFHLSTKATAPSDRAARPASGRSSSFRSPICAQAVETRALLGWRGWGLVQDSRGYSLTSLGAGHPFAIWSARAPRAARCLRLEADESAHPGVPWTGCSCGFYAHRASEPLSLLTLDGLTRRVAVVGTVKIWGRIVEHERGYRAQFAFPNGLALCCKWCLGNDIETVLVNTRREMTPLCLGHIPRQPSSMVDFMLDPEHVLRKLKAHYAIGYSGQSQMGVERVLGAGRMSW